MRKSSMSTGPSDPALDLALGNIPQKFRKRIVDHYLELKRRGRIGDATGSATAITGFCESVLRFLQEALTGTHVAFGTHIANFANACSALEQTPANPVLESQRLIIPKAILFIQTLRNKRGMGHIGGDVDANAIDLSAAVGVADWIVCELLRAYHQLSLEEAQALLDRLATRQVPDVWRIGETKRVLRPGLNKRDQAMLLLYGETSPVAIEVLHEWVETSRLSNFKASVLNPLHRSRLIEWDSDTDMVVLSPLGERHVEKKLLTGAA